MAKCREGEGKWIGLNYFVCQNGKWVKTKTGLPKPKRRKPKAIFSKYRWTHLYSLPQSRIATFDGSRGF